MRSSFVRRGDEGRRASRYRWGALGIQRNSRCLDFSKRWRGYSPSPASVDPPSTSSDGVSETDPPRLTRLDEPSSRTVPTSDVPISSSHTAPRLHVGTKHAGM